MPIVHLVARLAIRSVSLVDPWGATPDGPSGRPVADELEARRLQLSLALGRRLWSLLRWHFPASYGAILMPEHLHLVAEEAGLESARLRLSHVLRRAAAGLGRATWQPVPLPTLVPDPSHLRRQVRYVALNPCRRRLAADPLEWLFSTHRDVMQATVDPWVTAGRLAGALGESERGFAARWHRYVSSDPSVSLQGTEPSVAEPRRTLPERSLADIRQAVIRTFPCGFPQADPTRRGEARNLFLALARHQGITDLEVLAAAANCSTTTVWRAGLQPVDEDALLAATRVLADRRLLHGPSRR